MSFTFYQIKENYFFNMILFKKKKNPFIKNNNFPIKKKQ